MNMLRSAVAIAVVVLVSIGLRAQQLPNLPGDRIPTTAIDLSSTLGTPSLAYGINDIGTIVGSRHVTNSIDPFIPFRWSSAGLQDLIWTARPERPRFCVGRPDMLPFCRALAVNNNDEVVGDWWGDPEVPWGLLWLDDDATRISLGTAYAINDATTVTVVGFTTVCFLCPFAYRWTPSTGLEYLDPGAPRQVAPESEARTIRNDGVVAGWHCLDLRPFCDDFQGAVVWRPDGGVTDLGFGIVNAISDRSLAVGRSGGRSGYPLAWRDGTAIQITPAQGEAFDVNEAGYVVGTINVLGEPHAFVWHEARGLQDLGPGEARGIDEAGNIVGWRTTGSSFGPARQATLWQAELRVEDLFIGLEAIAGRLLAGIDGSQAEKALRDIFRARDAWTGGDSKRARQRLRQALDAMVKLNRSGELSDVRATAVLSLGNTLADRL